MLKLNSQSTIFVGYNINTLREVAVKEAKVIGKFLFITHQEGEKYVDEIRKIYEYTRAVQKSPLTLIIDADALFKSPAAQNAFLKVFEEPDPNFYLILLTTNLEFLLSTIKSRAQIQFLNDTPDFDTAVAENWLHDDVFGRLKTIKSVKNRDEATALVRGLANFIKLSPQDAHLASVVSDTLDRLSQNGNTKAQLLNLAIQ